MKTIGGNGPAYSAADSAAAGGIGSAGGASGGEQDAALASRSLVQLTVASGVGACRNGPGHGDTSSASSFRLAHPGKSKMKNAEPKTQTLIPLQIANVLSGLNVHWWAPRARAGGGPLQAGAPAFWPFDLHCWDVQPFTCIGTRRPWAHQVCGTGTEAGSAMQKHMKTAGSTACVLHFWHVTSSGFRFSKSHTSTGLAEAGNVKA